MAVPSALTYSTGALVAAQGSLLTRIDAGTGAGKIKLRDSADVLLATIPLTDPAGTVSAGGVLTITASGPDTSADNDGVVAYGEITDSDDNVEVSIPALEGVEPVSGFLVMTNLTVIAGSEIALVSCVIG